MKRSRGNEEKKANRILAMIVVVVLVAFFVINLAARDRTAAETENRSLMQRPKFTWQGFANGTYAERLETYESDQFVWRSAFREIYVFFQRVGGDREENGVYLGKKKQLLEDIAVPDRSILSDDIAGINLYAQTYPDVATHVLLVPDAASILSDRLPALVSVSNQDRLFLEVQAQLDESIVWMDGISAMQKHTDEKLYYLTDPHWTTEGAYQVFLETASDLGISDPYETEYESYCAAYNFNGTLAATSGFRLGVEEEVDVYLPVNKTSYLVTYVDEKEKSPSLYSTQALDTRDKYDVFLGGNHSLIEIDTAAESSRVLLVVKDSFANCYIPFLVPYFTKIVVADPRYYAGDINDLTETYGVTDTLFLYSGNSFFTDTSLEGFLGVEEEEEEWYEEEDWDEEGESVQTETVEPSFEEDTAAAVVTDMPSLEELKDLNYRNIFSNSVIMGDSVADALVSDDILSSSEVFAVVGYPVGEVDASLTNAASTYPNYAFFTYGLNDMDIYQEDVASFKADYEDLLLRARELMPDTKFYVTLILPVSDYGVSLDENYSRRDEYNQAIRECCDDLGITCLDLSFTLLDGYYSDDGAHPLPDFYYGWLYYMAKDAGLIQ